MARIFIDGFESGNLDCWDEVYLTTPNVITGANVASGIYALDLDWNGNYLMKNVPDSATYYMQLRTYGTSLGGRAVCSFFEDTIQHVNIVYNGSSYIDGRRDNTSVEVGQLMSTYTQYLIEVYVYIHESAGRIVVKVNGIITIDFTGDTQNGGTGIINKIRIGADSNNNSDLTFDDIVIDDAQYPNGSRIFGLSPNGVGNSSQWTPLFGSNYDRVNDVPEVDTEYVSVNTNDQVDTYAIANMSTSPDQIRSVQVMARARSEGAATPTNLALVVRSNGADYVGSDKLLSSEFANGHTAIWENDPDTAALWIESGVNAMEAGIKSRA